ncbi:MAG: trigger factor [Clostridiaceae bacterium]|jgi:trigger factor|nr:trigger factor [Clostridiaceae bacterium]
MIKIKNVLKTIILLVLIISLTGCSNSREPADSTPTPSPSGEIPQGTEAFDYSEGIDEDGLWKDIKAIDYVELIEYKGISIPEDTHTVTDEEVQAEIDALLEEFKTREEITDRAIEDGDTVNIDYVGSVDGVEFEGGSTEGMSTDVTIGLTNYIDDFLEQLIGHKPGESFDIEVTFPEDYHNEELSGKDAVFATTINYIVDYAVPEFTNEFVAEKLSPYFDWSTTEEARTYIHDSIQRMNISNYINDYLTRNIVVKSVPESLLKYQEDLMIAYFRGSAEEYGMKLEEYLANLGIAGIDALLEMSLEENKKNAESFLIYQAIIEDSGIKVTEEDISEYFKENLGTEDYSVYEERFGLPYLKLTVLSDLVMDYLYDNVVLQ